MGSSSGGDHSCGGLLPYAADSCGPTVSTSDRGGPSITDSAAISSSITVSASGSTRPAVNSLARGLALITRRLTVVGGS